MKTRPSTINLNISILLALIRELAQCENLAYENAFYRSLGASMVNEWTLFHMKGGDVRRLVSAKVRVRCD